MIHVSEPVRNVVANAMKERHMNDMTPAGTDLAVPEEKVLALIFADQAQADALFERVKAAAMSEAPDLSTAAGRKRIASLAYKVAQTKSAVDAAGKQLGDEARKQIAAIDATRRELREKFDALKADVRRPLDEWEAAEEAKAEAIASTLAKITVGDANPSMAPEAIRDRIAEVETAAAGPDCGWGDRAEIAQATAAGVLSTLRAHLEAARQRVADEAELARLRAEAAERERKDREEAEARAAEERRQADEKAAAERRAAEEKAAQERAAREAAEREAAAKREAELAEQRRVEAERREKEAAERAAREERARIQREQEAAEAAERQRQADRDHRGKIMGEAKAGLMTAGVAEKAARAAVLAIVAGEVPHVSIRF